MPRTLALIALLALAQPPLAAAAEAPPAKEANILFTVTVVDTTGGGDALPRAARLLLLEGTRGELRTGWRIPIPVLAAGGSGEAPPATTIQYQEVGLSIALEGALDGRGRVRSRGRVEVSAVSDQGASGVRAPTVSTFTQRFEVSLVDGATAVLAEAPGSSGGAMTVKLAADVVE